MEETPELEKLQLNLRIQMGMNEQYQKDLTKVREQLLLAHTILAAIEGYCQGYEDSTSKRITRMARYGQGR